MNQVSFKSALPTIFQKKGNYSVQDLAAIVAIGDVETATNGREYVRVEFKPVNCLNATHGDASKPFVRNVFGPLMDAEGVKTLQPADSMWNAKYPMNIYNEKGETIAHPKAGQAMLAVGELWPIAQVKFETSKYPITSIGGDGKSRTNEVNSITVVCWNVEDPLVVANNRLNAFILDKDGKKTDKRLGAYVTGITGLVADEDGVEKMTLISIAPPARVSLLQTVKTSAPTKEEVKVPVAQE